MKLETDDLLKWLDKIDHTETRTKSDNFIFNDFSDLNTFKLRLEIVINRYKEIMKEKK